MAPVNALIVFLREADRPGLCNSCGLFSLLVIGLQERTRSRRGRSEHHRTSYRFKSRNRVANV